MRRFVLAGNPNSGKTTLFNSLTGSTAHVGNWPGVTVDKREGFYRQKGHEKVNIVDLPGIYSLSPYSPEEVISRNFLVDDKNDVIIDVVDATNLERNLYLTSQLLEIDLPVVIALNMYDLVERDGLKINPDALSKVLGVPVVPVSALRKENLPALMKAAFEAAEKGRKATSFLSSSPLAPLIAKLELELGEKKQIGNPLFHAIRLAELDDLEARMHPEFVKTVEDFKKTYDDPLHHQDYESLVADYRYKEIVKRCQAAFVEKKAVAKEEKSVKIDKVLTNKIAGIPIFIAILAIVFHLVFSEDFLFLKAFGAFGPDGLVLFEGTMFEGLFVNGGINSPGVLLSNFVNSLTGGLTEAIVQGLESISAEAWVVGLIGDGILSGVFAVIGFLPQILLLFLFFSLLEDTGYMARVVFILDRPLKKLGLSGRSLIPMIMGFGCSVPAIINTRTLADEREKLATIRVIPFFSCGAKLPILTAVAGSVGLYFGLPYVDFITLGMYLLGIVTAIIAILLMRKTSLRGPLAPFLMELPPYRIPQAKSVLLHLWDKAKHFIQKAFTIILASTIVVWFLQSFSWNWSYVGEIGMENSILASLGMLIQPLLTPLGFGSQLSSLGWVFAVAAISGLIAKENVIGVMVALAAMIASANGSDEEAITLLISATNIGVPGLIAFMSFNLLTIPCFAATATAKAELTKGAFWKTVVFWVVTSYLVSSMVYVILSWWWTLFIYLLAFALVGLAIWLYNRYRDNKGNPFSGGEKPCCGSK